MLRQLAVHVLRALKVLLVARSQLQTGDNAGEHLKCRTWQRGSAWGCTKFACNLARLRRHLNAPWSICDRHLIAVCHTRIGNEAPSWYVLVGAEHGAEKQLIEICQAAQEGLLTVYGW